MHVDSQPAALLNESRILTGLSQSVAQSLTNIHIFQELDSTNQWLLEYGRCGAVCLAEQQNQGRGRRGRIWQSPRQQNIYFSLRWCFAAVPAHYGWLGLMVGVAVAEALVSLGLCGQALKWPNDIYHGRDKLGGILLQTAQPLQEVVIGIGLNVNMQTSGLQQPLAIEQPWTSLARITGTILDRNQLVSALLEHLIPLLQAFPDRSIAWLKQQWMPWDLLAGRSVRVHNKGETVLMGTAQGVDHQGQLIVQPADGVQQVFAAADVSVRW